MWNNPVLLAAAALGALCSAAPLAAQTPPDSLVLYEREVFDYSRSGRSDPFRSLLRDPELGLRFEDLALLGVLHDPQPARSVAVLTQKGSSRRIRARVGDRIGGIRIVAIRPRSVDVVVEEFGVVRRETLELRPATEKGTTS
jgi:hypothetical protein